MPSTISRVLPALLLPFLAACVAPNPVGEAAQAIIGGTVDPDDPGVVLLVSYPPDGSVLDTCSASIISGTVLLTAAHCVDTPNHPDYTYGVFPGADASTYPTLSDLEPHLLAVTAVHAHPDYDPNAPFTADLGVVVLANPIGVTPLPVNRAPLDASITGQTARIIGYGQVVYGQFNDTKHQATTVVDALESGDTLTVGDSTRRSCVGDSGGPALVKLDGGETIVGVDSYTDTSGCTEPAHYRRPDLYTQFLDLYAPPPAPDGGAGGGPTVDAGPPGDGGGTGGTGEGGSATTSTSTSTATSSTGTQPPGEPTSSGGCALAANGERGAEGTAAFALGLGLMALCRRRRALYAPIK
jgi:secreted trypsin-like serine protease